MSDMEIQRLLLDWIISFSICKTWFANLHVIIRSSGRHLETLQTLAGGWVCRVAGSEVKLRHSSQTSRCLLRSLLTRVSSRVPCKNDLYVGCIL